VAPPIGFIRHAALRAVWGGAAMHQSRNPKAPADLWLRLARLADRCEMRLSSEPEPKADGSWHWVWRAVVRERTAEEAGPPPTVLVMAPSAVAALVEALAQAEARGWIEPGGGLNAASPRP
jgi:hypothetical protein